MFLTRHIFKQLVKLTAILACCHYFDTIKPFSLHVLSTHHLSTIWCQTHDQNQHTTWFEFHIFRDHPTLAGKLNVRGCAFHTSSLTAMLPVGLAEFLFPPLFDLCSIVAEWLTLVRLDKTFPTYNYSYNSHKEHVIYNRMIFESHIKAQFNPGIVSDFSCWVRNCSSLCTAGMHHRCKYSAG